ncbi:MAG: hypothetical protein R3E89_02925 [Thiolinea sp.]
MKHTKFALAIALLASSGLAFSADFFDGFDNGTGSVKAPVPARGYSDGSAQGLRHRSG